MANSSECLNEGRRICLFDQIRMIIATGTLTGEPQYVDIPLFSQPCSASIADPIVRHEAADLLVNFSQRCGPRIFLHVQQQTCVTAAGLHTPPLDNSIGVFEPLIAATGLSLRFPCIFNRRQIPSLIIEYVE